MDVIILAGADNHGPLAACTDTPYEATIMIQGRPMVDYVVDAVIQSKAAGRVVVVGPEHVLAPILSSKVYRVAQCGHSIVENLLIGLEILQPRGKILIVTSDIPLITTEAIDDFVARCEGGGADVYYPICPKEGNEAKYPGVMRTYVKLREGIFTGGNLTVLDPGVVAKHHRTIERAVAMRKKPGQMARLLGFRLLVKYLLHTLSIHEVEERVHKMFGFRGVAVICPYPEVGIDVDKPSDLDLVIRHYRGRGISG